MVGLGFLTLGIIGMIIVFILVWVISSIAVYLSAKIIGVKVPFLRALVVTLIADIVSFIIVSAGFLFTFNLLISIIGLIIGFVISLVIYKYLFNIGWTKTFIMLIIAGVIFLGIMAILLLILAALGYLALSSAFSGLSAAP